MAEVEQKFKLTIDEQALQRAAAGINRVDSEVDKLRDEFVALDKAAKRTAKTVPDAFDEKQIKRAVSNINRAERAMLDYGDAASAAAKRTEALGDIDTNLSAIRGLGDFAGAGGAVAPLQVASEVAAAAEGFGRLGPAIQQVSNQAIEGSAAGTKLASGLQSAIPGLTSSAANMATLGATAAGVGIAIGAVVLAFNKFNEAAQRQAEAFTAQFEARRNLSQEIAAGSLTVEDAQSKLEEYNRQLAASESVYADAQAAYDRFEDSFGAASAILKVTSSQEDALSKAVNTARQDTENWQAQITELERAIEGGALAASTAAAAEDDLNKQRIATANGIAQVEQQLLAARSQSSDQIRSQIDNLNAQVAIIQQQELALRNAGEDTSALTQQIDVLGTTALRMKTELLPAAEAQEAMAKSAEEAKERFKEFGERLKRTRDDLIAATEQYNTDIENIQNRAYEQLAAAQEKYNEAQIDAAEKLADSQEDITEKLAEKIADLGVDAAKEAAEADREFRKERAEEIRDYQRDEQDAAQDHAKRLIDIRKDAAQAEEDAILSRDFKRLFEIRRNTGRQLEAANEEFNEERAARQADLQEKLGDIANEFAEERALRQQEYQERIAEAQQQAQEERAQIQEDYAERRAELAQNLQEERAAIQRERVEQIALRNEAIREELALIASGHEQRLALEAQFQQRMLAQANNILSGGLGGLSLATGGAGLSGFGGGFGGGILNNNNNVENNNNFNIPPQLNPEAIAGQIRDTVGGLIRGLIS